jgi:hypothetical protein
MTDIELIIRSSVQVVLANKDYVKPEGFGSGCIIMHQNRKFFVSVSHVTDLEGLTTFLETNQPFDERGPVLMPLRGICYFDQIHVTKDMPLDNFEEVLKKGERLDICFAELIHHVDLFHNEMDFGAFQIGNCPKITLMMDLAAVPTRDEKYGFYGQIRPKYEGKTLVMTPTLKNNLRFRGNYGELYIFLAPKIIKDTTDYEGCSGAPILDSQGRIVALACAVKKNSQMIFGFPIQACKKLLDYALQTGTL